MISSREVQRLLGPSLSQRGCIPPVLAVFYVVQVLAESIHQSELCLSYILRLAAASGDEIDQVVEPAGNSLWYDVGPACGGAFGFP